MSVTADFAAFIAAAHRAMLPAGRPGPAPSLDSLRGVCGIVAMAISGSAFAADAFPAKPVRFIVGFPPGGVVDIVARTVAPGIADALGA
jgi:hypothetical protein